MPIGSVKHAVNFDYNHTKWGLDKITETYLKIVGDEKVSVEAKYVFRMFYGVVGNAWLVELSRTIL